MLAEIYCSFTLKKSLKYILGYFFIFFLNVLAAQENVKSCDSLLAIIKIAKEDTSKINALNNLSKCYLRAYNYDKAIEYAREAQSGAVKLNYRKGEGASYNILGDVYWYKGDEVLSNRSYFNAFKIFEQVGDSISIAVCNRNIGWVYLGEENYETAMKYFTKALAVNQVLKRTTAIINNYCDIGIVYSKQGMHKKGVENFSIALKIAEKHRFKDMVSKIYNNIGRTYELMGEHIMALDNFLKSFKLMQATGDRYGIASSYINIGFLYLKQGEYKKSEYFLNNGLLKSKEIESKNGIKEAYASLFQLFSIKGDYKKAYEYHKLYSGLKDTLLNEESSKQITEMNAKYENEKKERDIQLLTKNKELQQSEIGRQKLIRNSFVCGLAIALLLAFVLLNRFQITRKQKGIIEYQNLQIVESINYSKKIQDSLLPSIESMQQAIPSLFVFYKPKNIVSGDFYFFKKFENYILLACVDCTGHGVSGGFMSTLGSLLLDKIANDENLTPSEILVKLSDEIIRVLHQQDGGEIQDGMDLSVCLIDRNNRQVEFSGARNGIIVVTNNEAIRYKASPLPVGGNYVKKGVPIMRNFQTQTISLNANDWVYMYTDGFIEQLGGTESIPMNYEQFERCLVGLSDQGARERKYKYLEKKHDNWKNKREQTDDILIVGFQT
jgi:serine phosphatase RsbU (regulator of sigma subunit)